MTDANDSRVHRSLLTCLWGSVGFIFLLAFWSVFVADVKSINECVGKGPVWSVVIHRIYALLI